MSRIKYVHVIEQDNGERLIRPGKGKRNGSLVVVPDEESDLEDFDRREWERVDHWKLPESMPKSEFVGCWNDHLDDDQQPSPIPEVLEAMESPEVAADA